MILGQGTATVKITATDTHMTDGHGRVRRQREAAGADDVNTRVRLGLLPTPGRATCRGFCLGAPGMGSGTGRCGMRGCTAKSSTGPAGGTVSRKARVSVVRRDLKEAGEQIAGPTNRNRIVRQPRWMTRAAKTQSPDTCTESAEVDAAGISGKVGAPYPGRSEGASPRWRHGASRGATGAVKKSAEGIVGRLDAVEGPNRERRVGARALMTKQTLDSMAEMPESAVGGSRRNRRGSARRASNVTAGRGNGDPSEQRWTGEPSLTPSTLADGFVNRRIRNRTYGGVGGRRGGDLASYPIA